MGIFRKTLQRHGASRHVPQQAFQLVTPMRWDLGVRMERKPVDTGTAGARQCGVFPFIPKARANAPDLLAGPLPKGKALRDGGGQGAGEGGLVVHERIIPRGHGGVDARLQVSEVAQRADDPPADRLDYRGNIGITGRLALEKARREALVGPIKIDPLKEDSSPCAGRCRWPVPRPPRS